MSCSQAVCDALPDPTEKEECEKGNNLHKMLSGLSGCRTFDDGQRDACECIAKDKAPERRKKVLQKFYEKYVPDSVHKVDGLAKKADSSKKFAALITKLVTKYPDSIKRIADPQQRMMDDWFKQAEEMAKKKEEEDAEIAEEAVDIDELLQI